MAKDDYNVIVFRVLTYLYACLKRVTAFDSVHFEKFIINDVNEDYFVDVLKMMSEDELIKGFSYVNAWGDNIVKTSDYQKLKITSKGIDFLTENSKMKKIKDYFLEKPSIITSLVKLAL